MGHSLCFPARITFFCSCHISGVSLVSSVLTRMASSTLTRKTFTVSAQVLGSRND